MTENETRKAAATLRRMRDDQQTVITRAQSLPRLPGVPTALDAAHATLNGIREALAPLEAEIATYPSEAKPS